MSTMYPNTPPTRVRHRDRPAAYQERLDSDKRLLGSRVKTAFAIGGVARVVDALTDHSHPYAPPKRAKADTWGGSHVAPRRLSGRMGAHYPPADT